MNPSRVRASFQTFNVLEQGVYNTWVTFAFILSKHESELSSVTLLLGSDNLSEDDLTGIIALDVYLDRFGACDVEDGRTGESRTLHGDKSSIPDLVDETLEVSEAEFKVIFEFEYDSIEFKHGIEAVLI